jgi:hypothetical protein
VDRLAWRTQGIGTRYHPSIVTANVLLTDDGVPMLLDFNLSVDVDALAARPLRVAAVHGSQQLTAGQGLLAAWTGGATSGLGVALLSC